MSGDILFVYGLLFVTIALFVSDKIRLDVTAVLVMVALTLSGILPVKDVVSGFGSTLIMLIAGLFVIGEGLFRTGVAAQIGHVIARFAGNSEIRLLAIIMPAVAGLSAFMSSTGAVAIFIPIVVSLSREAGISQSRVLMPIAFAGLIGGMLTLIGTPPNIAVSTQLERSGFAPFNFFDFTPIGFAVLVIAMAYILLIGRRVLPERGTKTSTGTHPTFHDMACAYGFEEQIHRVRILPDSPLIGKTVFEAELRKKYCLTVVAIERGARLMGSLRPVLAETQFQAGDLLVLASESDNFTAACQTLKLEDKGFPYGLQKRFQQQFGIAETLVVPRSPLIGKTVAQANFRRRQQLNVMSIRRGDQTMAFDFASTELEGGDVLLVSGTWQSIENLAGPRNDIMLMETPREISEVFPNHTKAPMALIITLVMLGLMIFNVLPSVTAVLCGALAMVLSGCVKMEEAYSSMNWQSLVLIAGMLPLSKALQVTGGANLIVDGLITVFGDMGPMALMAGLFVLTSLFSQFISNTATTVLVAPIAISAAQLMQLAPQPFLMTVAIAASTAFATPVASPVNTLALGPGQYKFFDFAKVGVPLQVLAMVVTLVLVPIFFPF